MTKLNFEKQTAHDKYRAGKPFRRLRKKRKSQQKRFSPTSLLAQKNKEFYDKIFGNQIEITFQKGKTYTYRNIGYASKKLKLTAGEILYLIEHQDVDNDIKFSWHKE